MTFSIAGICRRTGALGCAMATSSMAAGARVLFLAPDVGLVLTQARTDPRLGTLGLDRLAAGRVAADAMSDIVAATPHAPWRQLAVVDRNGGVAAFTGSEVMAPKGARIADGAVALGNAVADDAVIDAILAGFEASPDAPLADRLLSAIERGSREGGEGIPLQSAAIKVTRPGIPYVPIDLRVDCSATPIADLERYWALWAPMVDGYVERALDPANALPAAAIERHSAGASAGRAG
jgi:uncharacterized Ntn-hydrolase superfamily protein